MTVEVISHSHVTALISADKISANLALCIQMPVGVTGLGNLQPKELPQCVVTPTSVRVARLGGLCRYITHRLSICLSFSLNIDIRLL